MITQLTPEQEAQLEVYAEKWRDIALSTDPANRSEAEQGVKLAYLSAGLAPPSSIIWCESPNAMRLATIVLYFFGSWRRKNLGYIFRNLEEEAERKIDSIIDDEIVDAIWIAVWYSVRKVIAELTFQKIISDDMKKDRSNLGQHQAHWLGFYAYLHDIFELHEFTEKLWGL